MKLEYDLKLLSKYRTPLMGFAILLVMFSHTTFDDREILFPLRLLHRHAFGGVDIFFFLSGLGIYFAFQKENVTTFLKRRFVRILPYYLPVLILFTVFFLYRYDYITFGGIFTRIFMIDSWFDKTTNGVGWYIPTALFYYLLTPLFMKLIDFNKNSHVFGWLAILFTLSFVVDIFFGVQRPMYDLQRFCVYLLGIYTGCLISKGKKINPLWLLGPLLVGILSLAVAYLYMFEDIVFAHYFRVFPFFFVMPPVCIFMTILMNMVPKYKFPVLSFFGLYTLNIYIFHERISEMVFYFMGYSHANILWATIITIISAVIWQKFISALLKKSGYL